MLHLNFDLEIWNDNFRDLHWERQCSYQFTNNKNCLWCWKWSQWGHIVHYKLRECWISHCKLDHPCSHALHYLINGLKLEDFSISFCDQSTDCMMMQSCNCILAPMTWMVYNLQQDGGIFVLFQLVNCFWAIYCSKHFTFRGMEFSIICSIIHSLFFGWNNLTFKYVWTNHLSTNSKTCALVGTKKIKSTDNNKSNNTTSTTLNVYISCLPIIIFVYLRYQTYVKLAVEIVLNSCINSTILKS